MSQSRSGRTVSVALLVALVAAMVLWLRNRSRPIQVGDPPEWPPLPPSDDDEAVADEALADAEAAADDEAEAGGEAQEAGAAGSGTWRSPNPDGSCPEGFAVKANIKSGIFHVPGGRFYERTKPERCYPDAGSAIADGYRQAKT